MNYLKQKNLYWQKHNGRNSLKGNECALYFYLLETCDTTDGWVDVVEVRNSVLMDVLGISHRPYQAARDRLQNCGLLDFESKNGSPFTKYCLFDADTKTLSKTFVKKDKVVAKVEDKVQAKVEAKVEPPSLIINTKPKTKGIFAPPTLEAMRQYCKDEGYNPEIGERAWRGYDAANWHDSKGAPIKSWKQKLQHVWFKPEHKMVASSPYIDPSRNTNREIGTADKLFGG